MITLEKLIGDVKRLPRDEQERLLEILQREVAAKRSTKAQHSNQKKSFAIECISLETKEL